MKLTITALITLTFVAQGAFARPHYACLYKGACKRKTYVAFTEEDVKNAAKLEKSLKTVTNEDLAQSPQLAANVHAAMRSVNVLNEPIPE